MRTCQHCVLTRTRLFRARAFLTPRLQGKSIFFLPKKTLYSHQTSKDPREWVQGHVCKNLKSKREVGKNQNQIRYEDKSAFYRGIFKIPELCNLKRRSYVFFMDRSHLMWRLYLISREWMVCFDIWWTDTLFGFCLIVWFDTDKTNLLR